ncbi:MAG TPA: GntR family transcriptional regulator [Halanaerobiales bacterium]|nr:GntR family transcriptional regulator [Halanaerobiales bacterium]
MANEYLPKYIKIKNDIEDMINEGKIKPGSKLPTENELSEKYGVSRHTVRKALNILRQEGLLYRKQGVGTFYKSNSNKTTKNIGFISISLHAYIFADMLSSVDKILYENGYQILLGNSMDNHEREKEILKEFIKKNVDGLIIEPAKSARNYPNTSLLKRFVNNNIPVTILDSKFKEDNFNNITVDDEHGGILATEHLLEMGHENIAMIYKGLHKPALGRFRGYKQALKNHKIPVYNNYVKQYLNSEFEDRTNFKKEIEEITKELINADPQPTAIFCFNDQVAIFVKEILQKEGYDVPADISIIGFDNSKQANLENITSVAHPKEKVGEKAAKITLERINDGKFEYCEDVMFKPKLVKRGSVKRIQKRGEKIGKIK